MAVSPIFMKNTFRNTLDCPSLSRPGQVALRHTRNSRAASTDSRSTHPLDSFARTLATRVLPGPRRSRWTHLTYTSLATCRNPGGTSCRGPAHAPVLGGRDTQENHRVWSRLITMVALFRAPGHGFGMPRTDEGSGVPAGRQAQR